MPSDRFPSPRRDRTAARIRAIDEQLRVARLLIGRTVVSPSTILEALTVLSLVDDIPAEPATQRRRRNDLRAHLVHDVATIKEHRPGTSVGTALLKEIERLCRDDIPPSLQTYELTVVGNGLIRKARGLAAAGPVRRPKPTPPTQHIIDPQPPISSTRCALHDHLSRLPQNRGEYWHTMILQALPDEALPNVGWYGRDSLASDILELLWPDLSTVDDKLHQLRASERATHLLRCRLTRTRAAAGISPEDLQWREKVAAELNRLADGMDPPAWDGPFGKLSIATAFLRARLRRRASAFF